MECIKCGCTDENCSQCVESQGEPCHWVAPDKCSRCFDEDGNEVLSECEAENEKYNLPCPHNAEVMCIQMPCDPWDDNYCDDGCPNKTRPTSGEGGE